MSIQKNRFYSIKEVSAHLGINTRKLARLGLKHNIELIDNKYMFSGEWLIYHFKLDAIDIDKDMLELFRERLSALEEDVMILKNKG